jgi:glycosyltransferase involved in cell wall biosynthesis
MSAREKGKVDVSVVVCTYNRSASMVRAVRSVLRQCLESSGGFEVLVVDDGSEDDTVAEFHRCFGRISRVHYCRGRGSGYTTACNDGINAARGDWVAFCDDDQEAAAGWLQSLYATALDRGAAFVGGPIHLTLPDASGGNVGRVARLLYGEYLAENQTGMPLPPGGNRLIARRLLDEVGLYDERITGGGADLEFALRAQAAGARIAWSDDAIMQHHVGPGRLALPALRRYAFHAGYSRSRVVGMARGRRSQLIESALRLGKAASLDGLRLTAAWALRRRSALADQVARMAMAAGYALRTSEDLRAKEPVGEGRTFRELSRG